MSALADFAAGDTLGHIGGQEGCQQVAGKESASEGHGGCQGARMLMLSCFFVGRLNFWCINL